MTSKNRKETKMKSHRGRSPTPRSEPCVGGSDPTGEALVSEQVSRAIEPRNIDIEGAQAVLWVEGQGGMITWNTSSLTFRGPTSSARLHSSPAQKLGELKGVSGIGLQLALFPGIDGKASPKPSPQAFEQSDEGIVPKIAAKTWVTPVESKEERPKAKGNVADGRGEQRTQSRSTAVTVIERIRLRAKEGKKSGIRFTNLLSHLKRPMLQAAYGSLNTKAAAGVDSETWHSYGVGLTTRLQNLEERLQKGSYKPQPVRRVFIPKADGSKRPLGIPALEDKIVQQAVRWMLEPIYETVFLGCSYGFRPDRSAIGAVQALHTAMMTKNIGYLLDADIKAFFDNVDHAKLLEFMGEKIGDPRILQLISAWLKAGVMTEQGIEDTALGTPQGGVISPLLANVYLHHVLDRYVVNWRNQATKKDVIIIRYADDFVIGTQTYKDMVWIREALRTRFTRHGLTLHPDKTRVIEFGRMAHRRRRNRGQSGQPDTFDFLGFTHVSHQAAPGRPWKMLHITSRKKRNAKLKSIRQQLRLRRHEPVYEQYRWLCSVLIGHANYYGVDGNSRRLNAFRWEVVGAWLNSLKRRSQRAQRLNAERFFQLYPLPPMRISHHFSN